MKIELKFNRNVRCSNNQDYCICQKVCGNKMEHFVFSHLGDTKVPFVPTLTYLKRSDLKWTALHMCAPKTY